MEKPLTKEDVLKKYTDKYAPSNILYVEDALSAMGDWSKIVAQEILDAGDEADQILNNWNRALEKKVEEQSKEIVSLKSEVEEQSKEISFLRAEIDGLNNLIADNNIL